MDIGLTARGLDGIGDIQSLKCVAPIEAPVSAGAPLLEIQWDGHRISTADELYHTIYEYVEGTTVVSAPTSAGPVCLLTTTRTDDDIDEDTPLATLALVDGDAGWNRLCTTLLPDDTAYDEARTDDATSSTAFSHARLQEPVVVSSSQ